MFDISILKNYSKDKKTSSVFYECFRIYAFCDNLIFDTVGENTTLFLKKSFEKFNIDCKGFENKLISPWLFSHNSDECYDFYSFFKDIPQNIKDLFIYEESEEPYFDEDDDEYYDDDEFYDDYRDFNGYDPVADRAYLKPEYAHMIRSALVKEDPDFFKKLCDFSEEFFKTDVIEGEASCSGVIDSVILMKLYLNLELDDRQTLLLMTSQQGERKLSEYLNEIDEEEFINNLSDLNKAKLSRFSSMTACRGKTSKLSALMLKYVDNPLRYEDDSYYRTGIAIKGDLALIYEHFFKGEFTQCQKELGPYIKKLKAQRVAVDEINEFVLIQLFCKMMSDTDIENTHNQIASIFSDNLYKSQLIAATAVCINYLLNLKKEKEDKCLSGIDYIFGNHTLKGYGSSIESINECEPSIVLTLIIASAISKETNDPLIVKGLFSRFDIAKLKLSYPALARRIYNCSKYLAEMETVRELESEEFYDFSTPFKLSSKKLEEKLNRLKSILKIDEKKPAKKTSRAKKKANLTKHMIWVFDRKSSESPYPVIADFNDDTGKIEKIKVFDVNNFFNSRGKKDYISAQDTIVAGAYNRDRDYYYRGSYSVSSESADIVKNLAEINHPYAYLKTGSEKNLTEGLDTIFKKVSFEYKKVELCVRHRRDNLVLSINNGEFGNSSFRYTIDDENGRVYLYKNTSKHNDLIKAVGRSSLFPEQYLDQILLLGQSEDIVINAEVESQKVQANPKPVVLIENQGKMFFVSIRVKPCDDENCQYKFPGRGEQNVLFTQKEDLQPVTAVRNLKEEKDNIDMLLKAVDKFGELDEDDTFSYSTDDTLSILGLLEQLKENSSLCSVNWSGGKKLNVASRVSSSKFKISSDIVGSHILVDGKVELDELKYLSLKSLLNSLNNSHGNFIAIDDENYISITSELKSKLEKLKAITHSGKKDALSVHPLAGSALEDLLSDLGCQSSEKVKSLVEKRENAMALEVKVPKNLTTELRAYQEEGYSWLYRLSQWGVGACLADDMGLGKTVQTIALMLKLASRGPVMVVAPTSVCPNWKMEINRFAPSLNVLRLKESDNREQTIGSLKKGDVLIVSYGLFANENELLSRVKFELAVYDEAQALKNSSTQRAKSAASMKTKMAVALTGTPIENNLDDLWSIFNIINPGLLGTLKEFHSKFADIQDSKNTARILKLIISPFIKRRLKGDVLDDLPPRTEQVICVEPSQKEKELYEALRRSTAEELEKNKLPVNKNGQRRLQILAALTRMRQFCCDPSLLDAQLKDGASSKTSAFEDLLEEALSCGHRLLVFSQFVGYLSIIRDLLDKKQISYQYLDGQTPEKARAQAIENFQNGEGDVFLISLKAGGQGLNLTSADYVVHLDPWWNPAVEDQATDRAYRIGQTRPVNVFRLVIKDSLEEKILELHAKKRELAADFLEGTSSVAAEAMKLSEEELLELIS
jgi:SNF2 family DNA or RNA helicase